jgi:hypothetical protein
MLTISRRVMKESTKIEEQILTEKYVYADESYIHVLYQSYACSYRLDEVDSIMIKKKSNKVQNILLLIVYATGMLLLAYYVNYIFSYLILLSVFLFAKNKYQYFIVLRMGKEKINIRINPKDKNAIVGEIREFLSCLFKHKLIQHSNIKSLIMPTN